MASTEVFKGVSIDDLLQLDSQKKNFLCELLYQRTGGLPRLVHYSLEGKYSTQLFTLELCKYVKCRGSFSVKEEKSSEEEKLSEKKSNKGEKPNEEEKPTKKDIEIILDEEIYKRVSMRASRELIIPLSLLKEWHNVYHSLLVLSLLNVEFPRNMKIKANGKSIFLLDAIQLLNIFISPAKKKSAEEATAIKIKFAEWTIRYLGERMKVKYLFFHSQ